MKVDPRELRFSSLSLADTCGRVFMWQGRVFRGIAPSSVSWARTLLASSLMTRLVAEGLFPPTTISDLEVPGFALVLEHERVPALTYPGEWSFTMLKDAAACVLRVAELAREHGYELRDSHSYNVGFVYGRAKYLDFGSFSDLRDPRSGWLGREEFVRSYLYPLEVWARGNPYLARRVTADVACMPHDAFLVYRHPAARLMGRQLSRVGRLISLSYKARLLRSHPPDHVRQRTPPRLASLVALLQRLDARGLLPGLDPGFDVLRRRLGRLRRQDVGSEWGDYQDGMTGGRGTPPTPRMDRVIEIVRGLSTDSVTELGGNQGAFSRLLVERQAAPSVVCSDADDDAVDRLYRAVRGTPTPIQPVVLDFMRPDAGEDQTPPHARFQSDTVLALAVTHHLLLRAPFFDLGRVLEAMRRYGRRYVLTEFMPMGLHDGRRGAPVPSWYTRDWFRAGFSACFDLLLEEQLEENRVLFVGRVPVSPR